MNVSEAKKATFELNEVNALTDRVKKRREEYWAAKPRLCSERSRLATQSWKETEGEPTVVRRAKLLKKVLEGVPVVIREGELVVGSQTKYVRGTFSPVDINPDLGMEAAASKSGKLTVSSEVVEAYVSKSDAKAIVQDAMYWKGKTAGDKTTEIMEKLFGSWPEDAIKARLLPVHNKFGSGNSDANYEKIFNIGLSGVIKEAEEEIQKLSVFDWEEVHKLQFLEAVIISCAAVIKYAERHAQLARKLAAESTGARKQELEEIAEICEWVPRNPARNFHEAVQSFWFIFLSLVQETAGFGQTPARFDQYMFPLYQKDIEGNNLTRQQAAEILGCLWVKFLELDVQKDPTQKEKTQGTNFMNMTVGGVTPSGEDATNEMSFMVLHVSSQVKSHQPHLTLRYHDKISEDFLAKAIEANKAIHGGIPQFTNDKVVIEGLLGIGIPLEDARDWAGISCSFPYIPYRHSGCLRFTYINIVKVFELALNNGVDPVTGKKLGIDTGDPRSFSYYQEVYDAFKKQFKFIVNRAAAISRAAWSVRTEYYPVPLHSATMADCLRRGKHAYERGATLYPQLSVGSIDRGHQNVANSLIAIKQLVFEQKKITMRELLDAIANDYEGREDLRQMLLRAPKWGNDEDAVDNVMRDLWDWTAEAIREETNPWGYPLTPARHGVSWHYFAGKGTGALPDGRKAFTPLAPGALDPMAGTDTKGPTGIINSCLKLNFVGIFDAVLNLKISPSLVETPDGIGKVVSLIRTYFDNGGHHIQFNIIDRKMLLEAQEHPEQYRDLIVRVAGYSAYFVELPRQLQDEIISRTEQTI